MITKRKKHNVKKRVTTKNTQDSSFNPFLSLNNSQVNYKDDKISFFGNMKKTFVGSIIERKVKVKDSSFNKVMKDTQIKVVTEIDREVIKATQKNSSTKKLRNNVNIVRDSIAWSAVVLVNTLLTLFLYDLRILTQYCHTEIIWNFLSGLILVQLTVEVLLACFVYPLYCLKSSFFLDVVQFGVVITENRLITDSIGKKSEFDKIDYFTTLEFYMVTLFWAKMLLSNPN